MFFKQKKSITVKSIDGSLYIFDDERFNGGESNCPSCRFYPCVINKWYGKNKSIQDCKLWNEVEPCGQIIDRR